MNFQKGYEKLAKEFANIYKDDPNVIGITLSGGVSRGTGDPFSEVDLNFYVKSEKDKNLPMKWPNIGNDVGINGVWFDIHVKNYSQYLKDDLGMVERWDLSNSKILLDRDNKVKNLVIKKARWKKGERKILLEDDLGFGRFWCFSLARTFVERGDIVNAHMLLNESLDLFVDYYFVKNNQFIPHFKWKYHYFQKLKTPSRKVKDAIFEAYKIREYTKEDLLRRFRVMDGILIKDIEEPLAKQNKGAVENFKKSLKKGVTYHNPFDPEKIKEFEFRK